jgi:hypothetical protein
MTSSSVVFILLAKGATEEEDKNILHILTQIEPSLLVMHFLQLVLEVLRHLTASASRTWLAISAIDCFGWICEPEIVLVIPRLIKFVYGYSSAD